MARESSLRGSGRNASGPLLATWQMLEWIRDNGPADRETIKDNCAQFVDPGYARRWWGNHLTRQRQRAKDKSRLMRNPRVLADAVDIAAIPALDAQRHAVVNLLARAVRLGTLQKSEDGMYSYVRMPTRTPAGLTVEQVTSNPNIQRRHVYEMELVRQLRAANKRGAFEHGVGTPRLLKKELAALLNWLSTFDHLDASEVTITGVELEAIVALRAIRDRSDRAYAKQTSEEKDALRALWLALDNFAQ